MTFGFEPYDYPGGAAWALDPTTTMDLTFQNQGWHRAMEEKYLRAARYPWLPVASGPDPGPFIVEACIAHRMRWFKESREAAREACCRLPGPKHPPGPVPYDLPADRDLKTIAKDAVQPLPDPAFGRPPEPR